MTRNVPMLQIILVHKIIYYQYASTILYFNTILKFCTLTFTNNESAYWQKADTDLGRLLFNQSYMFSSFIGKLGSMNCLQRILSCSGT